jgi:WD40 repeat protein
VPRLAPLASAFLRPRQDEPGAEIRGTVSGGLVARRGGAPSVVSASFDGSGDTLFTATQLDITPEAGRLWDARTGRLLRALSGPGSAAATGVLSDDGSLLATVESSGAVTVWRTETGERVSAFRRHTTSEAPYSLFVSTTFSHDGSLLLTGDTAGNAYVWRTADGRLLNSFEGPPQEPRSDNNVPGGAISRDNGLVLFTNPWDQLGRLYRVGAPELAGVLRGTSTGILSSSFNADGSLIVTNGEEGSRVWDVAGRESLLTLPGDRGTVAFAGDGRSVVLTPDPRFVSEPEYRQTFACEICGGIDALLRLARERASRELTAAERSQYLHR